MHRRRAAVVPLLATALLAACASAAGPRPDACRGAVPYRGQPWRGAPPASAFGPSGPSGGLLNRATAQRLDSALTVARGATAAPSGTAAVAVADRGVWSAEWTGGAASAARSAPSGSEPTAAAAPLHWWASAGKTFTAVAILQLVDEGKLALADPVSRWVAGVPNGHAITIEMLLDHTSGLASANEAAEVRADPRARTLEEELAVVRRQGAVFCPGGGWRYSNTGYLLLGRVIERVDGRTYQDAITARVIRPLGLRRLRVLGPTEAAADVAALPPTAAGEAPMQPSTAGPAGNVVGSAADMIRWWQALLDGRLLAPSTTRRMFQRLYPMFGAPPYYGLGVMLFEIPEPGERITNWLGHAGGAPGAQAVVAYAPADGAFVAVALTGDGSAVATANLLLRQLRGLAASTAPPPP